MNVINPVKEEEVREVFPPREGEHIGEDGSQVEDPLREGEHIGEDGSQVEAPPREGELFGEDGSQVEDPPREGELIGEDHGDVRSIRYREDWDAKPSVLELKPMEKPIMNVVLTYTDSEPCEGQEQCDKAVQALQNFYQVDRNLPDIPYSFLVSKDGLIYEARGWDYKPFVPKKAFPRIRGTRMVIAQINTNFDSTLLSPAEMAIWDLIQHGVDNELIHKNGIKTYSKPWI